MIRGRHIRKCSLFGANRRAPLAPPETESYRGALASGLAGRTRVDDVVRRNLSVRVGLEDTQ